MAESNKQSTGSYVDMLRSMSDTVMPDTVMQSNYNLLLDHLGLGLDLQDFNTYRTHILNGYTMTQHSLYLIVEFIPNVEIKLYFIDLMILIYYLLKVNRDSVLLKIKEYLIFDDNRRYKISASIIPYIDELLNYDINIGELSQNNEKISEILLILGNLQILNFIQIKKHVEIPKKKVPPENKLIWRLTNESGVASRAGPERRGDTVDTFSTASNKRGTFATNRAAESNRNKYLKYKIKYLILKKLMNI
jgi:hypothetical protein